MAPTKFAKRQPSDVRDASTTVAQSVVVAVVDGRPSSAAVLAWAADEALCRGLELRVVTVYGDADQPHAPRTIDKALQLQRGLRRLIARGRPWINDAEHLIARGELCNVVVEATRDADLLVAGDAVAVAAANWSPRPSCPVVIVPDASSTEVEGCSNPLIPAQ
jgi:hypothetical protein